MARKYGVVIGMNDTRSMVVANVSGEAAYWYSLRNQSRNDGEQEAFYARADAIISSLFNVARHSKYDSSGPEILDLDAFLVCFTETCVTLHERARLKQWHGPLFFASFNVLPTETNNEKTENTGVNEQVEDPAQTDLDPK